MMHSRAGAYFMAPKGYKRWMNIGPDYAYGRESWASFISKLKELQPDAEVVGELWPKLMEKDFTPFIQKIVEAKPDAVWSSLWGNDAVNFVKQALPTGLFNNVKFAFTDGAALETLAPLGKDMPNGVFVAARYFFLSPDTPLNRNFVKTYLERFKEYPDYMAQETYAGVYFLKAAIERARTTDPQKVIKAIESEPLAWETPEGWKIMRKGDHSVVEDVVWGETLFSDKYGFVILKNLQAIQAEQICRTPEELKAVRDSYEKRMKEAEEVDSSNLGSRVGGPKKITIGRVKWPCLFFVRDLNKPRITSCNRVLHCPILNTIFHIEINKNEWETVSHFYGSHAGVL